MGKDGATCPLCKRPLKMIFLPFPSIRSELLEFCMSFCLDNNQLNGTNLPLLLFLEARQGGRTV